MIPLSDEAMEKLETAQNIWIASVRPDGRPHLTPVWFAWAGGKLYVSIDPDSKEQKDRPHPHVALYWTPHLSSEGTAAPLTHPCRRKFLRSFCGSTNGISPRKSSITRW
jgi:hypothetical protein